MPAFLNQFKELWGRLPMGGRFAVIGAAVGTLALIGALVYYGSQPEYGVLFSDLKPADAQAIVEKLKGSNVPYQLTNNGTTVSVPSERISEMRLQMAGSGVLSGGHVGFDLFDKTSFGATDFTQQVNYRRAIEGELGKTLEGMDEVESARVHLTPKKDSIYSEKEEGAKASVMLRVRQGKELSDERTDAIVSLISSSVEGLDPSNVSVMDTRGRLLTSPSRNRGAFSDAGVFNAQLEAKQKYEAETAARVISLLEPISGSDKIRADVSADVDFSQVEQTEEKYDPAGQVIKAQQTNQETRNPNARNQPQIVGARANDPTAPAPPAPAPAGAAQPDQRSGQTIEYNNSKTVRRTIGGGGRINRLSVSVVVDHKNVNGVQTARTPEELQKIQELVTAAVGADQRRGDAVVVQTMPFDKPEEAATSTTALDRFGQYIPLAIKYGALILIAFLLFLFVIRPARKALKAAAAPRLDEQKLLTDGQTEDQETMTENRRDDDFAQNTLPDSAQVPQLTGLKTVAELEAEMAVTTKEAKEAEVQRAAVIKNMIEDKIGSEPELIAGALRGWLKGA